MAEYAVNQQYPLHSFGNGITDLQTFAYEAVICKYMQDILCRLK